MAKSKLVDATGKPVDQEAKDIAMAFYSIQVAIGHITAQLSDLFDKHNLVSVASAEIFKRLGYDLNAEVKKLLEQLNQKEAGNDKE